MKRSDLEHVIRAAAAITNEYELVVVGSQSRPLTLFWTTADELAQLKECWRTFSQKLD